MLVETKARVGVFSIALGAYLPQFPQLVPEFQGQYEAFKQTIPDTVELVDGGMVTTYRRPVGPATLAVTVVDGWFVGDRPAPSARTTIASVALEQPGVTWADLPPVAVSEGARDVHLLLGGAG